MAHHQAVDEGYVGEVKGPRIERVDVLAFSLPVEDGHASDGTLGWDATTMVVAEVRAAGVTGLGYTYAHASAARVIEDLLAPCVVGLSAAEVSKAHARMVRAVRNQGREGLAAMAVSAVDVALWDLKARVLGVPLAVLLGPAREEVPVYASGGFTSRGPAELERELAQYRDQGMQRVKIKIGREPRQDRERVRVARSVLGDAIELMVDANGAYSPTQALRMAETIAEYGVSWFEEPVSSDDLSGLRWLRARAPAGMAIAAGEYGYHAGYFARMLGADAVDVLQADATRCSGITGFLQADALCVAHERALSSHCAPALHCHVGAAAARFMHLEYFRDHVLMEQRFFEGVPELTQGNLRFSSKRAGLGIALRRDEVKRHVA